MGRSEGTFDESSFWSRSKVSEGVGRRSAEALAL